ncbi:SchA/CurD-like domain-containing protein [Actinacidiphila rubida]|uniref:Antibiotic biosynthesis monooxygenase n=1 Tax=Actinacidiphila rubida TaxID=310780 RepID=A0A1H8I127_9ACTN|nr:SchA/CurD-like domain-containing protein [Actinacidiphila rubida]SEN62233.1 Antibiotic biosynthesis monooxygenase [Actinacidiphila rubida]
MTTLDERRTAPSPAEAEQSTRLRVVLLLDVLDGKEQQFLKAYEQIRHQVAAVPGHISDQLCQSLGNSSQWLITSEWESSEPFLEWVESAAHRKMVEPLHGCVRDTTSLRFVIARETPDPALGEPRKTARAATAGKAAGKAAGSVAERVAAVDPLASPPLCTNGVVRHAITFTVRPGSEEKVAKLLADYESPRAQVDDTTRLLRTSLYMHGNRVVRAVEVTGDLGNALRHVAQQPEVRAVEEAINPYLEEDRDLTDPASARAFFARAALPAVEHATSDPKPGDVTRVAYLHPIDAQQGPAEARRLAGLDAADCIDPSHALAAATVFQRGDVLVRVLDVNGQAQSGDPHGLARGGRRMDLVTDRSSHEA